MTTLRARFLTIYGETWSEKRCPDAEAEAAWDAVWSRGLAGMTPNQIRHALGRCERELKWPPTSPAEFRALGELTEAELGAPGPAEALNIATRAFNRNIAGESLADRWRHPVIFHVVRDPAVDMFRITRLRSDDALKAWALHYRKYIQRLASGERFDFPEEPALTHKPPASRDRAHAAMAEIWRILGYEGRAEAAEARRSA